MTIIALTSAAGSPGVSSSVIGLALAWKRPCLVIEADPTGSSAMLTGYMRQYAPNGITSVLDLEVAFRQTGKLPNLLELATPVPNTNIRLLSGIRSHVQARSMEQTWHNLMHHIKGLDAAGIDVLIDLGRLGLEGYATTLLEGANLGLLVLRSTLPAIVAAHSWASTLTQTNTIATSPDVLGLLVIGEGHPYTADEISKQLKIPTLVKLPLDATTAEVFSLGTSPGRRFTRSPLYQSLPPAVAALTQHWQNWRNTITANSSTTTTPFPMPQPTRGDQA